MRMGTEHVKQSVSLKKVICLVLIGVLCFSGSTVIANHPGDVSSLTGTFGYQDGPAGEAQFRFPSYAAYHYGTIYISDTQNHRIRAILKDGTVKTVAGSATELNMYGLPGGGNRDGIALFAQFNQPKGIAIASDGTIYIADSGNDAVRVVANGQVSTLIENLHGPTDIVIHPEGYLIVSDTLNHRILKVHQDGTYELMAGGGYQEDNGWLLGAYGDGQGAQAQFNEPTGLTVSFDGTVYVADTGNQRIRAISSGGQVTTIAGSETAYIEGTTYYQGGFRDGDVREATFNFPQGIEIGLDYTLYIADTFNHRIRKITKDGTVSTLAGDERHGRVNGYEKDARFDGPTDLVLIDHDRLVIVDHWNHAIRLFSEYTLPHEVYQDNTIQVVWENEIIPFDVEPVIINGRTMVPIRQLAEVFGYTVEWNGEHQRVAFTYRTRSIFLTVGNTHVYGSLNFDMDIAPYIEGNRTLVPLRFVTEAFELDVTWLENQRVVLIRE